MKPTTATRFVCGSETYGDAMAPQDPFTVVTRYARQAVRTLDRWMREYVRGYAGLMREEQDSDAVELALRLVQGRCTCGLPSCPRRHNLAARPAEIGLRLFAHQAVIGPVGLTANSIDQGMFYRLILQPEYGMLVADIEFKRCTNPTCFSPYAAYEEDRCPERGCSSVFSPEDTEVIAQRWLIVEGRYVPVRRWCCGGTHYFAQRLCRGELVPPFDEPHHRLLHGPGGTHDRCPWRFCPSLPEHPQQRMHPQATGTTLWVRRELVSTGTPNGAQTSLRQLAYRAAVQQWLVNLDSRMRTQLQELAVGLDVDLAGADAVDLVEWLRAHGAALLSPQQMDDLGEAIRRALEESAVGDSRREDPTTDGNAPLTLEGHR